MFHSETEYCVGCARKLLVTIYPGGGEEWPVECKGCGHIIKMAAANYVATKLMSESSTVEIQEESQSKTYSRDIKNTSKVINEQSTLDTQGAHTRPAKLQPTAVPYVDLTQSIRDTQNTRAQPPKPRPAVPQEEKQTRTRPLKQRPTVPHVNLKQRTRNTQNTHTRPTKPRPAVPQEEKQTRWSITGIDGTWDANEEPEYYCTSRNAVHFSYQGFLRSVPNHVLKNFFKLY